MAPAPGWYRDPADASAQRWWDGSGWTERVRRPAPAAHPTDRPAPAEPDPWPVLEITPRPVRRRPRRPRALGRVAVALAGVAALALGATAVLGDDDPAPTRRGAIDDRGGPEVPPPRRAEPGLLRRDALVGVDLAAPEGAASIVTHGARYSVTGLARPETIGRGDEARRPAEGERLLAVELAQGPGEVAGAPPTDVVRVEVEGEDPVALPEVDEDAPDVTGRYLLSAPEDAAVDLVVTTGEVVQRLSLVDGARGDDTASVLLRDTRQADVGVSGPLVFSLAQGGLVSPTARLTVGVRVVRLAYFYGADGTQVPPDPAQAWLVVGTTYTWPPEARGPGAPLVRAGLGPEVWRLRAGAGTVAAVDLAAEPDRVAIAFPVPADITEGTLVVGGTQPGAVVFDTGPNRVEIPFRLPG
ncbi:DUF2510 domain-containing protein [Iamia sp. SCSIO 61187]|uniref:DUF2510 domain-containing protein n=1 Tax=Iamia sp. SCSIO 61187 TaxID=2722752 RepID=UPI001C631B78|nr:DUF2510 domain-containing protein [Iamia sp. SCSIO 61187]QYG92005.1 DUF2510 domain-containing protein [Iamia sp. SCSIO 61187]